MAQFNNVFDFTGSYSGSYDGRDARLTIKRGVNGVQSFNPLFTITFTDVQRNEVYQGIASVPEGVLLDPGQSIAVGVDITAPDDYVGRQAININAHAGQTLAGGVTFYVEGNGP